MARHRYEDWLDQVWGVPKRGSSQQRQPVMRQAVVKRARKAAKRRRDAELTRLGRKRWGSRAVAKSLVGRGNNSEWWEAVCMWTRSAEAMDAIRRGRVEVVP